MPSRSSKKEKKDFSQVAFEVVARLTGDKPKPEDKEQLSAALDSPELRKEIMREMGRRGGKKGGVARMASLDAQKRKDIAVKAAKARWSAQNK